MRHGKLWLLGSLAAGVLAVAALIAWRAQPSSFPRIQESDLQRWRAYGGDWNMQDGVYSDRLDGRGDKILGGPLGQGDYAVSSEIRFDGTPEDPTFGDAGLLLRVQDPSIGVDAMRAYYGALRMDDHALIIGNMSFSFRELAAIPFPHELHTNHWYRLTFTSLGCTFRLRAEDEATHESAEVSYVEQTCDPVRGQVGLRSYYAHASWRNLQVKPVK